MSRRPTLALTLTAASGALLLWWLSGGRVVPGMSAHRPTAAAGAGTEAETRSAAPTSISGRVTFTECGSGSVADALLTLDGRFSARTDSEGRYRFDGVPVGPALGLPASEHVLTAIASTARTKIIRVTPTSCPSPCIALDF